VNRKRSKRGIWWVLIEGVTDVKPSRPVPKKVVRRGVFVRNKPAVIDSVGRKAGWGIIGLVMANISISSQEGTNWIKAVVWAGVLGANPTKGATVGCIGEGEAAAGFLQGKGAAFDPPLDALKGKDRVRA
jgi:hypothetical protein